MAAAPWSTTSTSWTRPDPDRATSTAGPGAANSVPTMTTGPNPLAQFIDLPVVSDPRGNLCVVESARHVPFEVRRIYYLYDVPSQSSRAGHAHKALYQLLIPVTGSFDVRLHDGRREERVTLNRPNRGLHVGPMMWRDIDNFSSGAVCLALASELYDEADYIRDFDDFLAAARG